jgi:hypothetical protein
MAPGQFRRRSRAIVACSLTSASRPVPVIVSSMPGIGSRMSERPGDQHHRGDGYPGPGERVAGVIDVLPGVGGARLDDDGAGGDAEGDGMLGVMDGLAAREPGRGGRAVAAGEHQLRE